MKNDPTAALIGPHRPVYALPPFSYTGAFKTVSGLCLWDQIDAPETIPTGCTEAYDDRGWPMTSPGETYRWYQGMQP